MDINGVHIIDPSQDKRWDAFVESHPAGWVCHTSAWGRLLERSFKHIKGYYLAIFDENERITAGLPIFSVRSWLTGNSLVSIPHATLSDPLVATPNEMSQILEATVMLSKNLGIKTIEIKTFMSSPLFCDERFQKHNYFKHHYLPLVSDPEQLKKTFDRSCVRQKIARALGSKLELRIAEDRTDLAVFYKLHLQTRKQHGLPPQPYKFFEILWELLYPSRHIMLLSAFLANKPVASLILFKFRNRVSAEYAASDNTMRELSPNHLLFWEAIKMACHEGFEVFDFGRTPPQNQTLMDFKKRWGTKIMELPQFFYPNRGNEKISRNQQLSYRVVQTICRKAPDAVLPYIGRFCYNHLG